MDLPSEGFEVFVDLYVLATVSLISLKKTQGQKIFLNSVNAFK